METIGFVGVGKIGLPIAENLIKSGYRVVGFRRSSLAEFEKIGGVPARSAADVGAQADIVFSCLPSTEALDDAMQGPTGLVQTAKPGQIVIELGSHPVPDKKRQIAPLQRKGAKFIDGEVSGTPGMVAASISANSVPRAGSSWSIICWSPSISRRPRKPWRSGSRPASTCR
jgi:3-hydroxyisobutyrate dehydrogenase